MSQKLGAKKFAKRFIMVPPASFDLAGCCVVGIASLRLELAAV